MLLRNSLGVIFSRPCLVGVREEYTDPESGCRKRRLKDRRGGTPEKRTLGMGLTPPSCKKALLQKPQPLKIQPATEEKQANPKMAV